MGKQGPFYRTVRQYADDTYSESGGWQYIRHPKYANRPPNYIRPFLLLQDDLKDLFKYIEPADVNLQTFSFRIHELLTRTCIELEANLRAILIANKYGPAAAGEDLNMRDYCKIEQSHYLSQYLAKVPYWTGIQTNAVRQPFKPWASGGNLSWYKAYNQAKHDRASQLTSATLENLLDAFTALVIILSAQFMFEDFSPAGDYLALETGPRDGFDPAIGEYFRVALPSMMPERYDFKWSELADKADPFTKFDYDAIK